MHNRTVLIAALALLALVGLVRLALSRLGDVSELPEITVVLAEPGGATRAIVSALEPSTVPEKRRDSAQAVAEESGHAPVVPTLEMLAEWLGQPIPAAEIAGIITGRLLSESGAWPDGELPARGEIVIDLVSEADHSANRRGVLRVAKDENGENQVTFAFRNVPPGRYELTLSSLSSFRWQPKSIFVSPPAADLEFMRYDADRGRPVAFRVFDSETGDELQDYSTWLLSQTVSDENGVLMHAGPFNAESFPIDARFRWSLAADGYAPFFGDETSFVFVGSSERSVAYVYLERGFGTRLVVLGPEPTVRPIAGAGVIVDGKMMGQTRSDGSFWVQARTRPKSIAIRYRDWVPARDPLEPILVSGLKYRGYVTAIMIRPPE